MSQLGTSFKPQLIKVSEAAALLRVSTSTIHNWIKADAIPYIELPRADGQRADYRIPLDGLVASLKTNYDLAGGLEALVAAAQDSGMDADALIRAVGGEPEADTDE